MISIDNPVFSKTLSIIIGELQVKVAQLLYELYSTYTTLLRRSRTKNTLYHRHQYNIHISISQYLIFQTISYYLN